ncbi:MAG: FAD:protein FMN transferase [Ilumatobacteraceae bacterium]
MQRTRECSRCWRHHQLNRSQPPEHFASSHNPLLGTRVTLRLLADDEATADAAEAAVIGEMDRLEGILSAYRPDSEWSRWRSGQHTTAGPEIAAVLSLAAHWWRVSDGAFHPLAGVLRARWLRAVEEQTLPSSEELAALAASITDLPYGVHDGIVSRTGDCSRLDVHAIAKGWIVDRAAALAVAMPGIHEVLLNAGGDLLHRGSGDVVVGIEDPRQPFDNAAPFARVRIGNAGLATSGDAHRPMTIDGHAWSHVLDPRTGQPVGQVCSATVIATDAATADAMATVVSVLSPADALAAADQQGVAVLLVQPDGRTHHNARWAAAVVD